MATRKRISDLLRQEAQKSSDTEDKPVIEITAEEVKEQDNEVTEVSPTGTDRSIAEDTSPTKAELEATIAELRAALEQTQQLEQAHQHEVSLQQQVIDLQSELAEQKKLVQKLQKDLEQFDKVKAELTQAKKEALQLADANSKLIEENNTLKKESEALTTPRYKPVERKISTIADVNKERDDFANKTWLLD